MKLGQIQEEIWKASLPVSTDLSNEFSLIILETDQRKIYPSWGWFWRNSKNIYNFLLIMLLITSWTLMLMLHIRQSIYLVLTNVLPSFSSFFLHFWCSTLLGTCEAMICSYFGIKFLLFFMKIENTVYTSFQNVQGTLELRLSS